MNIRIPLFLFFSALLSLQAIEASGRSAETFSPPFQVVGQVVEEGGEKAVAVEFATVSLFRLPDSSMVTGTTTDTAGTFQLTNVKAGQYFIRISFIGFEDITTQAFELSQDQEKVDLGVISLNAGTTLDEVVVTGQKSLIETRLDKRIFNASADMSSRGGTGLTLLNNVPGIEVDMDDNITLRGNGNVQILINGRPSTFSPATFLEQIPATSIEKIEIITNPGAKYDPEGTAGIINVILKEEDKRGFNGTVNGTYQQGLTPRYNGSAALNYRSGKWNTSLNYSYSNNTYRYQGTNYRSYRYPDTSYVIDQSDRGIRGRSGHNLRAGIDYNLNKNHTIYVSGNYQRGGRSGARSVLYENYNKAGNLSGFSERTSDELDQSTEFFVNAGWQAKFAGEDHKLDVDITYSQEDERDDDSYEERFFNAGEVEIDDPIFQKINSTEFEGILVAMVDYQKPLNNGAIFEAGYRSDVMRLDNDFYSETYDHEAQKYEPDEGLNNRFFYDEDVFAAYLTYGQEFGDYSIKLGLRGEQTYTTGELEQGEPILRDYFRLFPTLHNSLKYSEQGELMLSYSRRINRPSPWRLNPFTNFNDPLNLRRGNPYLLPEDIHSFEFGVLHYVGDLTINGTLFYRLTNDVMQRFQVVEEGSPVSTRTYENIGQDHSYGLEAIFNYSPYRWWTINTTINTSSRYLKNVSREGVDNLSSLRFSVNYNSQWRLGSGWNFQLNGRYRAPFDVPQGRIEAYTYINAAVRKSFFDDKLNIGLAIRDVFNTRRWRVSTTEQSGLTQLRERQWDSRIIGIDINYRFGKMESDKDKDGRRGGGDFSPGMDR